MDSVAFIFTICFVLLGPIKLIPGFARLTAGRDPAYRRSTAIWGVVLGSAVCVAVALMGEGLIDKYRLTMPALRLTFGLVLLLSALQTIFPPAEAPAPPSESLGPFKLALSPLAMPTMVPPAGVAAILTLTMIAKQYPAILLVLAGSLAVIMTLNLLVMYFNDRILRTPGLLPVLQLLGGVLIIVQVGLAIETMLDALRELGVLAGA